MASLSSHLAAQLDQVRREGLFKPERILLSPQGPSVTVAPLMTAPLGSVTVPSSEARSVCASAIVPKRTCASTNRNTSANVFREMRMGHTLY